MHILDHFLLQYFMLEAKKVSWNPAEMQSCHVKYQIICAPHASKTVQFLQHAAYNLIKNLHAGTVVKERTFLCVQ